MRRATIIPLVFAGALVSVVGWLGSGEVVLAEEGLEAFDRFVEVAKLDPGERVLGMVAFYGEPQPPQWLILTGKPVGGAPMRESVFARGRVLAARSLPRLEGQDLPDLAIDRASLKVGSGAAFRIAEARAREKKKAFQTVHYQLRVREEGGEPVWLLNLINRAQVSVGLVYLSARSGEVLRETWPDSGGGEGDARGADTKVSAR